MKVSTGVLQVQVMRFSDEKWLHLYMQLRANFVSQFTPDL